MIQLDNYKNALEELFKYFDEPVPIERHTIKDWRDRLWARGPKQGQKNIFRIEDSACLNGYTNYFYVNSRADKGAVKVGAEFTMLRITYSINNIDYDNYYILDNSKLIAYDELPDIIARRETE